MWQASPKPHSDATSPGRHPQSLPIQSGEGAATVGRDLIDPEDLVAMLEDQERRAVAHLMDVRRQLAVARRTVLMTQDRTLQVRKPGGEGVDLAS